MTFEDQYFVSRIGGREFEGLYSPIENTLHGCRGAKSLLMMTIVKGSHLNLLAAVNMQVVAVAHFALGKFAMALKGFIAVLGENNDDFLHFATAAGDDDSNDFGYRGILAQLDELRVHAILGMNKQLDFCHMLLLF